MPKTAVKVSSKGTCIYCQGEFEKSKMTQHLKFCKARAAKLKAQNVGDKPKVKLLHILVEGTYLPIYWMHLEIPADHTFYDLDDFLRETWVECCDHLSEFKVGKTSYMSRTEDMIWDISIPGDTSEEENEDEVVEDEEIEEEEEDEEEGNDLSPEEVVEQVLENMAEEFGSDLDGLPLKEIEAKITSFLVKEFGPEDGVMPPETQPMINMLATMVQMGALSTFRDMPKEHDMSIELEKALKVGQKFSYTYDFGSSTDLTLKVIAEREGIAGAGDAESEDEDEDTIQVMARNEPPVIPCRSCGKPAVGIFVGYGAPQYGAVCETCAKTKRGEYDEGMLPIVNSPRVGVCGYTGDAEYVDWDEEELDEEEDEDEEE
nr:hypothetical protein [Ktedonobacteraceae bacterium]